MCFRPPTAKKLETKCPGCGAVCADSASVCPICGEAIPQLPPPPGVSGGAPQNGARLTIPTAPAAPKAPVSAPKAPQGPAGQ